MSAKPYQREELYFGVSYECLLHKVSSSRLGDIVKMPNTLKQTQKAWTNEERKQYVANGKRNLKKDKISGKKKL